MMPNRLHRKYNAIFKHFLLLIVITFSTQSIIAKANNHHNLESSSSSSSYDEEEIVEIPQINHETNALDRQPSEQRVDALHQHHHQQQQQHLLHEEKLLLFAWRRLPTNKCSKNCGRGFRVYHLSCIDLKFNVRVEEKFCADEPNLMKPEETSTETCNEIDCPAEWTSIEYQECDSSGLKHQNGSCHLNVYKRAQCVMVDAGGKSIHLPDSSCSSATTITTTTHASASARTNNKDAKSTHSDLDTDVEISLDGLGENNNDIISGSNIDYEKYLNDAAHPNYSSSSESLNDDDDGIDNKQQHRVNNEPFYELGAWSECSGATCGQLGKRIRMVSCRLYLVKSSRYVELPVSSCQHLPAPDVQEPCYLDCIEPQHTHNQLNKQETQSQIITTTSTTTIRPTIDHDGSNWNITNLTHDHKLLDHLHHHESLVFKNNTLHVLLCLFLTKGT